MATPYLRFFGGINGIGGNQILAVASNGKGILLDFGLDFGINKKFFDNFMKIRENLALVDAPVAGLIPWPKGDLKGIYRPDLYQLNLDWIIKAYEHQKELTGEEGDLELDEEPMITEVLVSHAHLDHIGFLRYLNPSIKIITSEISKEIIIRSEIVGGGSSSFNNITKYNPIALYKSEEDKKEEGNPRFTPQNKGFTPITRNIIAIPFETPLMVADNGFKITAFETDHSIPG